MLEIFIVLRDVLKLLLHDPAGIRSKTGRKFFLRQHPSEKKVKLQNTKFCKTEKLTPKKPCDHESFLL